MCHDMTRNVWKEVSAASISTMMSSYQQQPGVRKDILGMTLQAVDEPKKIQLHRVTQSRYILRRTSGREVSFRLERLYYQ